MSIAVVFDSAGTLLRTYRVAKDVRSQELLPDIETTELTYAAKGRVLVLLYAHTMDIMEEPSDEKLSTYLTENNIRYGVACAGAVVSCDRIADVLYSDGYATIGDVKECIHNVWDQCKREPVVALNSGVMINLTLPGIEFVLTSGGRPFCHAKETICSLHEMGVATYVASGDRTDKLIKMADYLNIPHDNVHGVATPTMKAQIVKDLKEHYDTVIMVGDGMNDRKALEAADIGVLSLQQTTEKPGELIEAADRTINTVSEILSIVCSLQGNKKQTPESITEPLR